jgi:hypothetical protein
MRNAEISKKIKGTPLCAISKNLSGAPLLANRCREMPRGRRAFVWCLVPIRADYVQNHLIKPEIAPPFFSTERYPSAPGVRHAVAPYPVLLRSALVVLGPCPPLTGVARAGGGRGSPFAWLLGHARHCGFIPGLEVLVYVSVSPPGHIRGEGVCDITLRAVKPGRPRCPWSRVLRALRSDHFLIIPTTPQASR